MNDQRPTTDETEVCHDWRYHATTVMAIAGGGCVLALAALTLDAPTFIVWAIVGMPVAIYVTRVMHEVMLHAEELDALLAAYGRVLRHTFGLAPRAQLTPRAQPAPRAYTGETVKLDEVRR